MFKVKWDNENNGIILSNNISESEELSVHPRPVYLQELELLGINKYYNLPITEDPICWCTDRRYFYKGKLFFERKGANIYKAPEIIFNVDLPYQSLEPINVDLLVTKNAKSLKTLENEAMDFIEDCFEKYKDRVDDFVVAFSGGKDSQVILDLVSRVIAPEHYKVIFQDTDMELPCTHDIVRYTEEDYKYKFPKFKLYHATSDKHAIDLWKQYGPPSRTNRWCCSVMKTAVFRRKLKDIYGTEKQIKAAVFEGVRADESSRRSGYDRIGENVKHQNLINCRAIFNWNNSEIYTYILSRKIVINPGYRYGLTRIGCGVCPFASDWSEYVIRRIYPEISKKYVAVIENMGRNLGLSTPEKINEYISSGNWQKNSGGRGLVPNGSRFDVISKEPNYECIITNPRTNWKNWLYTISDLVISNTENNYNGELKYKGNFVKFEVLDQDNRLEFKALNVTHHKALVGKLSKVLNKVANCELCGVCEAECPTGALIVSDDIQLNKAMCVHCNKCLEVGTNGCIIAQRKQVFEGSPVNASKVKTSGVDKYSTFGLREEWISNFFYYGDDWFGTYPGLGPKMIPAAINWLREAELIDRREKKVSADLFDILKNLYSSNPLMVWQIIWVILSYNSQIVNTFVCDVNSGFSYEKDDLLEIMKDNFPTLNDNTILNPINALINMFRNSPLGKFSTDGHSANSIAVAELEMKGNSVKTVTKIPSSYVSLPALAVLLYKNAKTTNRYDITVSELLEDSGNSPSTVFGMNSEDLIRSIKSLTEMNVLSSDLLGGLDNVHLNKDFSEADVLQQMVKRL